MELGVADETRVVHGAQLRQLLQGVAVGGRSVAAAATWPAGFRW